MRMMMLLKYLQYRYVKARMTAYLDGDLPVKTRRFIARQIDENPLCYQDYIRAKQTRQELERALPTFGKPESGQLDNLWANIQLELNQPEFVVVQSRQPYGYSLSYGVAMLVLAIIMLAPFAIDAGRSSLLPVSHALPEQVAELALSAATPDSEVRAVAIAVNTEVQSSTVSSVPLQNTPAPRTPGS